MKKFKCIKAWARNNVGDVVEQWELKRFPPEIQQNNFIELKEVKAGAVKTKTSTNPETPKTT